MDYVSPDEGIMYKNWLHFAMTFSGTLEYNQAGVHSHKRPEMDFAKIIN